jgi:2-oxoglutarate ferredoxin oxidoreductase subunit gamma
MDRKEIRLAGNGGQGLILGANILFRALSLGGQRAAQSQSYEPTSRGGFCYSDVIVTEDSTDYPLVTSLDVVVALAQVGIDRSITLAKPDALILVDEKLVPTLPRGKYQLHSLPITARAIAIGNARIANIIALGVLAKISGICSRDALKKAVRMEAPEKLVDMNLSAVDEGFAF